MSTKRTGVLQRLIDFVLDVPPTRSRAERRYHDIFVTDLNVRNFRQRVESPEYKPMSNGCG